MRLRNQNRWNVGCHTYLVGQALCASSPTQSVEWHAEHACCGSGECTRLAYLAVCKDAAVVAVHYTLYDGARVEKHGGWCMHARGGS